jgi:hypothetical protein
VVIDMDDEQRKIIERARDVIARTANIEADNEERAERRLRGEDYEWQTENDCAASMSRRDLPEAARVSRSAASGLVFKTNYNALIGPTPQEPSADAELDGPVSGEAVAEALGLVRREVADDLSALRNEVKALRDDVDALRGDVTALQDRVDEMETRNVTSLRKRDAAA